MSKIPFLNCPSGQGGHQGLLRTTRVRLSLEPQQDTHSRPHRHNITNRHPRYSSQCLLTTRNDGAPVSMARNDPATLCSPVSVESEQVDIQLQFPATEGAKRKAHSAPPSQNAACCSCAAPPGGVNVMLTLTVRYGEGWALCAVRLTRKGVHSATVGAEEETARRVAHDS